MTVTRVTDDIAAIIAEVDAVPPSELRRYGITVALSSARHYITAGRKDRAGDMLDMAESMTTDQDSDLLSESGQIRRRLTRITGVRR